MNKMARSTGPRRRGSTWRSLWERWEVRRSERTNTSTSSGTPSLPPSLPPSLSLSVSGVDWPRDTDLYTHTKTCRAQPPGRTSSLRFERGWRRRSRSWRRAGRRPATNGSSLHPQHALKMPQLLNRLQIMSSEDALMSPPPWTNT